MYKVILKTALITLAAILVLALMLYGILSLFVPSAMVSLTDKLGMDGACARYSIAVYNKTEQIDDLAYAVERNYNAERYEQAAEYGILLLEHDEFAGYCAERESGMEKQNSYAQFASGIVSVSLYRTGDKEGALRVAFDAVATSFPTGNAVVYLLAVAYDEAQDKEMCGYILNSLQGLQDQFVSDSASYALIGSWIEALESFLAGNAA